MQRGCEHAAVVFQCICVWFYNHVFLSCPYLLAVCCGDCWTCAHNCTSTVHMKPRCLTACATCEQNTQSWQRSNVRARISRNFLLLLHIILLVLLLLLLHFSCFCCCFFFFAMFLLLLPSASSLIEPPSPGPPSRWRPPLQTPPCTWTGPLLDRPNFVFFFFLAPNSPLMFRFSGDLLVDFGWCISRLETTKMRNWALHMRICGHLRFKHHPKSTISPPNQEKQREKLGGRIETQR